MTSYRKTGIIIISDDIIKGNLRDGNSQRIVEKCLQFGLEVCIISIIPSYELIPVIREYSLKYDVVFTTGGIGIEVDKDKTYSMIAEAFNKKLVYDERLDDYYIHLVNEKLNEFIIDAFTIPQHSRISISPVQESINNIGLNFPLVRIKNIICLSGNPIYLEYGLKALEVDDIFTRTYSNSVFVKKDASDISKNINKTANEYNEVKISTLRTKKIDEKFETKVTFGSRVLRDCLRASAHFLNQLAPSLIVHYDQSSEALFDEMDDLVITFSSLSKPVCDSLEIIEECFDTYGYSNVCVSFNGGKDCTVLLFLVYSVFIQRRQRGTEKLPVFFILYDNSFLEVREFISEMERRLDINVIIFRDTIKNGLRQMMAVLHNMKAIFLGVRRSDPNMSEMKPFQMTDPDWPSIMRVSPILDWSYGMIWDFIRYLSVPYCSLYNDGYTSIGTRDNTKRNDSLIYVEKGVVTYKPAFLLNNDSERLGRCG